MTEHTTTTETVEVEREFFHLDASPFEAVLKVGHVTLVHELTYPNREAWIDYYSRQEQVFEDAGDAREPAFSIQTRDHNAARALWNNHVRNVRGYLARLDDERIVDVTTLDNWKEYIPQDHIRRAVECLEAGEVVRQDEDETVEGFIVSLSGERDTVALDVYSSGGKYVRVEHIFARPKPKHSDRYAAITSQTRMIPGGRAARAKMVVPIDAQGYEELWADLILGTKGYAVTGKEIDGNQPLYQKRIPLPHKIMSINAVFTRLQARIEGK